MCFRCSLWNVALIAWLWGIPMPSLAQKDPNCGPPNVLLVVGTSGSMSQAGKIEALRTTIESVVVQFKGQLRFGLISFSGSIASAGVCVFLPCSGDSDCLAKPKTAYLASLCINPAYARPPNEKNNACNVASSPDDLSFPLALLLFLSAFLLRRHRV